MGTVTEERRSQGGETPVDTGRGLPGVRVTGKAWERRCILPGVGAIVRSPG